MPTTLRRGSFLLVVSVCAVAVAQLACSLVTGETPTPQPAPSEVEEAPPTDLPAYPTTAASTEPSVATAEEPSLPDRPLSESGPWYVFASDFDLWALNPDGSGLTSLWDMFGEGLDIDSFILWPAPSGGRVAIIQINDRAQQTAPLLRILELPSGTLRTIANLLPREVDYEALSGDARSAAEQVWAAVGVYNQLAWSSDGRLLAFNGAIDGPSADVYVYDVSTEEIARLTDGPDQSVDLTWSPDDSYIVHGVAENLYYGYSGLGYEMLGAWAVPPDPTKTAIQLYDHAFLGYEEVLGWPDDSHYLGDSLDGESLGNCGYFNLRTVDIHDGEGSALLAGHYDRRAFDPETQTMLLVLSPVLKEFDCSTSLETGVYLFDVATQESRLLPGVEPESIQSVTWSEAAELFFLGGGSELVTVNPEGNVTLFPSIEDLWDNAPIVGPSGDVWAMSNAFEGTLAVGTLTGQLTQIKVEEAWNPFWSLDGAWLFFFADGVHLSGAATPDFEPVVLVREGLLGAEPPVLVNP